MGMGPMELISLYTGVGICHGGAGEVLAAARWTQRRLHPRLLPGGVRWILEGASANTSVTHRLDHIRGYRAQEIP